MSNTSLAYIYGLVAVLLWSTVATAFKIALSFYTPLQLVFVAVLTSIIALSVIILWQKKHTLMLRQFKRRPGFYLLSGILNPFLYYFVLFEAYDLLPAQQALSLNYTWAILLPILAVPLLGHKLTKLDVIAALIAYSGVYIIATGGNVTAFNFDSPKGIAFVLSSTVIWCLYWVTNTKDDGDATVSLLLSFLIGLPLVTIAMLIHQPISDFSWQALTAGVYVGLFEMGITFVLWLMALKTTEKTSNITTLVFLTPVLSVGFIALILKEQIASSTYIGLCFILTGLILQKLIPQLLSKSSLKISHKHNK
ncbi:DMT family transporter [Shewanella sp. UCD-KL21]|uniref:DMT family transporter n=1 Tax=Shewanella sp. UCD-KL21 TaxID=1917164 RepID=UPI000970E211|nr:DMT family transporter [Shewanella sp. UCD-KL21]